MASGHGEAPEGSRVRPAPRREETCASRTAAATARGIQSDQHACSESNVSQRSHFNLRIYQIQRHCSDQCQCHQTSAGNLAGQLSARIDPPAQQPAEVTAGDQARGQQETVPQHQTPAEYSQNQCDEGISECGLRRHGGFYCRWIVVLAVQEDDTKRQHEGSERLEVSGSDPIRTPDTNEKPPS